MEILQLNEKYPELKQHSSVNIDNINDSTEDTSSSKNEEIYSTKKIEKEENKSEKLKTLIDIISDTKNGVPIKNNVY